jgi:hypothetical protein
VEYPLAPSRISPTELAEIARQMMKLGTLMRDRLTARSFRTPIHFFRRFFRSVSIISAMRRSRVSGFFAPSISRTYSF